MPILRFDATARAVFRACVTTLFPLVAALPGCAEPRTEFDVINLRGAGDREHFRQAFDECYYTTTRDGRIDIVARRVETGGAGQRVTQLIHVRTEYQVIPGTTAAESSMINATVHYAVLDGRGGVCYEGAGFLSTEEAPEEGLLIGALERAHLAEQRSAGEGGSGIFKRVELTGTYRAERSRRRAVALLNELARVFGPQPDYQPPPRHDDPL